LFIKHGSQLSIVSEQIGTFSFLEKETVIEGKMNFVGEFRLDGKFEGEIFGGTLIIGETGVIKGKIRINTIVINGLVEGEVYAKGRVEIHSTGKFYGDLLTQTIVIAEGGIFEGHCKMKEKLNKEDNLHLIPPEAPK
jgi:cytoskeletal protein CcmA (bactofilin family)